jgi:hypothetical protein
MTPEIAAVAKAFGAGLVEDEAVGTVRVRDANEMRAARTRVATELKKLGLKKMFVRVARLDGEGVEKNVFAFRLPEMLPTPLDIRSLASLGDEPEPTTVVAPAPTAPTTTDATFSISHIFNAPPAPTVSFNCDSDPLA